MLIWCPAEIFTAQSIDLAAEFGAGRFLPWAARAPNRRPATATVLDPSHAAVGIWIMNDFVSQDLTLFVKPKFYVERILRIQSFNQQELGINWVSIGYQLGICTKKHAKYQPFGNWICTVRSQQDGGFAVPRRCFHPRLFLWKYFIHHLRILQARSFELLYVYIYIYILYISTI